MYIYIRYSLEILTTTESPLRTTTYIRDTNRKQLVYIYNTSKMGDGGGLGQLQEQQHVRMEGVN